MNYSLPSTGTWYAALSLLVDGSYVLDDKQPNQDLDLTVDGPNDSQVAVSNSYEQTHEVVKFSATQTGNYRFVIHRYRNGGGDNVIALVIGRR